MRKSLIPYDTYVYPFIEKGVVIGIPKKYQIKVNDFVDFYLEQKSSEELTRL